MLKSNILCALLIFMAGVFVCAAQPPEKPLEVTLFFTASCHKCQLVKETLIPELEKAHPQEITVIYRDIADIENYKLLMAAEKRGGKGRDVSVPAIVVGEQVLIGVEQIQKELDGAVAAQLKAVPAETASGEDLDLLEHFRSFTPLAVASAGLIDGINPCAFTVIVFFVSFLSLQGYRRRQLFAVGASFTAAVFLTYLALGLGLLSVFYYVKGFWLARRMINAGIGLFSIILGILAVYDFFVFKKTGSSEAMTLQLPAAVKNRIHKVIGQRHRKGSSPAAAAPLAGMVLTAFVTGFLVSLLEAVCTGQTYLPTITFILKTTPANLPALAYLVLYNLMFIVPLFAILVCALMGVSSGQFAAFLKKHFLTTKALMAALFFGLGLFLLWRG